MQINGKEEKIQKYAHTATAVGVWTVVPNKYVGEKTPSPTNGVEKTGYPNVENETRFFSLSYLYKN
jgi:hypothetical protein